MFFYRSWTGQNDLQRPEDPFNSQLYIQFMFHRWGFGALLLLTLAISLLLNAAFVGSFVVNRSLRCSPHWPLLALCIRDLAVTLILIPTAVDWLVVSFGVWSAGQIWCSIAGFLDFALASAYPVLLLVFGITLYTRTLVPPQPMYLGDELPLADLDVTSPPSVANSFTHRPPQQKPPSVVGSVDGYRNGYGRPRMTPGSNRAPFYAAPNRAGSVTGSIEGRLAAGRMSRSLNQQRAMSTPNRPMNTSLQVGPQRGFRASSPLREVDETRGLDDVDLWDAASLDYPGRESPSMAFDDDENMPMTDPEVLYHSWHVWLLIIGAFLPLAFGVPAAMMMQTFPHRRPGCSILANPFSNPHSYTIDDPGYNLLLAFIIVSLFIPALAITLILALICYHRRANKKFTTFVKMFLILGVIFVLSRCPVDIVQFKALMTAWEGSYLRDAMEIEYEIVLIWVTYVPLVLNPIVYFSYLGDARTGAVNAVKGICSCQKEQLLKEDKREEKQAPREVDLISTKESNIL